MNQIRLIPIYAIDTCSLTGLDGLHDPESSSLRPPMFSADARIRVWNELESMAREGHLKLIHHVKRELKIWNSGALQRLSAFPKHRAAPRSAALITIYREIFADRENQRIIGGDVLREKADGWLIATAKMFSYTIITEELPRAVRRRKRGVRIPDVCEKEGIPYVSLAKLARSQGWC